GPPTTASARRWTSGSEGWRFHLPLRSPGGLFPSLSSARSRACHRPVPELAIYSSALGSQVVQRRSTYTPYQWGPPAGIDPRRFHMRSRVGRTLSFEADPAGPGSSEESPAVRAEAIRAAPA